MTEISQDIKSEQSHEMKQIFSYTTFQYLINTLIPQIISAKRIIRWPVDLKNNFKWI